MYPPRLNPERLISERPTSERLNSERLKVSCINLLDRWRVKTAPLGRLKFSERLNELLGRWRPKTLSIGVVLLGRAASDP